MNQATLQIPALTVSQATQAIKSCLESTFPSLWIQGEISNFKIQSSGHLYFSIKDSQAQIAAVMFRGDTTQLKFKPKDGDQIIIQGELNVYPPSGRYQIVVREIRQVGIGELLLKLEELKHKLHKKGWFNQGRKKPLPKFPNRIGVVTSPTGAVIQDILHILTRRAGGFHLILNPVKVQGEGAALEIAKAISDFNRLKMVDVMIVGRGGGSLEDLWPFNDEIVAEAIFNSAIPVISAVGHETDHCIADYVADVRAPTPSAAAEIVVAERTHHLTQLNQTKLRLRQHLTHTLKHCRHQLQTISKHPIFVSPYTILGPWMQRLDGLRQDIDQAMKQYLAEKKLHNLMNIKRLQSLNPTNQIFHLRHMLSQKRERLTQACRSKFLHCKQLLSPIVKQRQLDLCWQRIIRQKQEKLSQMSASLHSVDPKNLLSKGYSILFAEKDHCVITSLASVKKEESIRILMNDGQLTATVKEIYPK